MFVKFNCGCIGIPGCDQHPPICIDACDDSDGLSFIPRGDLSKKPFTLLPPEEAGDLCAKINALMADGHGLQEIRYILKTYGFV
jgi:hypothetical protein